VVISVLLINTNENPQVEILRLKVSKITGVISTPFQFIPRTIRLYSVNRYLNQAVFELTAANTRLAELEAENERLRMMLNFPSQSEMQSVPAMVIGKSAGETMKYITIDRGEVDGLEKGLPVMSSSGLVGQTAVVDKNTSLVQLMLDSKFGAAVKIQRNRIDGILHWDSQDMCRLDDIPYTIDVRVGDILITSGMGGVYPKGLKTGIVTKISKNKNNLFQKILVEPYTDFYRLEEVFVLKK